MLFAWGDGVSMEELVGNLIYGRVFMGTRREVKLDKILMRRAQTKINVD